MCNKNYIKRLVLEKNIRDAVRLTDSLCLSRRMFVSINLMTCFKQLKWHQSLRQFLCNFWSFVIFCTCFVWVSEKEITNEVVALYSATDTKESFCL